MTDIDFKNVQTMIGADAEIGGDIQLKGGIIVYGTVSGSIETQGPVRIAQSGKVLGNIRASNIRIGGFVSGNVTVQEKAVLGEFSKLQGDLLYRQLLIEEGAQFEGRCQMVADDTGPFRKDDLRDESGSRKPTPEELDPPLY